MYKASRYNIILEKVGNRKFVFNTVSSAGAYIEKPLDNETINNELSDKDIDILLNNHFIVPSETDEEAIELKKTQEALYGNSFESQLFVIAPTLECNANCEYCFEKDKRVHSNMSADNRDRILEFITNRISTHKETKNVSVSFFGGEPTLRVDLVDYMSSVVQNHCVGNNIDYNARIITNGILMTSENCKRFRDAGIHMCQITIDGMAKTWAQKKQLPESLFYSVIENIKNAVDSGLRVSVKVNVDNSNKSEIPQLMRLLLQEKELNGKIRIIPAKIKKWNDAPLDNYMTDAEYFNALLSYRALALENNWHHSFDTTLFGGRSASCGMVRNSAIGIRYDGQLYRCEHCFACDIIDGQPAAVGDIEVGLYDNEIDKSFRCETTPSNCGINSCVECEYYPLCHGGCRAEIVINKTETICESVKRDINLRLAYRLKIKEKDSLN